MKRLLPSGCRLTLVMFGLTSDSIKVDQTPNLQPSIRSCFDGVAPGDWRRVSLDVMQQKGLAGTAHLRREMPGLESDDRLLSRHRTVFVVTEFSAGSFGALDLEAWLRIPGLKS